MSLNEHGFFLHYCTNLDLDTVEQAHDLIHDRVRSLDQSGQITWEYCAKHGPGAPLIQIARCTVPETVATHEILKHSGSRYDISVDGQLHHAMCQLLNTEIGDVLTDYLKHVTVPLTYLSGILPVTGVDDSGIWHRDTYELFDTIHSTKLPPWYLVCLLYLNDESDAPTELIPASHRDSRTIDDIVASSDRIYIRPKAGQILIMDGRTVHRGGRGHCPLATRKMMYTTIYPRWYDDPVDMSPRVV